MGGQGRCKHAREMGDEQLDEYKKRNVRAKKDMCVFVEIVAVCVKVSLQKFVVVVLLFVAQVTISW